MKIAFLGDLAIFESGLLKADWKTGLKKIEKILSKFDLVIANLEIPLTDEEQTFVCKGIHLKSTKSVVNVLKFLNIKGVCLANNHICDFGIKGMNDTVQELNDTRINFFGVNNTSWEIDVDNQKLSFHGFCCYSTNGAKYSHSSNQRGVIPFSKNAVIDVLEKDKREGRLSILSIHWGDEYSQLPNERQVDLMHELSERFDFILHGHHAHVMQGIEKVNNSLLIYNQGNFCFDECTSIVNSRLQIKQSNLNKESFILSVEIENNNIISWKTTGIYYDNNSIEIIDNNDKIQYLSNKILNCRKFEYKEESLTMIKNQKQKNLAIHNFKWFLSKLNYYSIGAKLVSYRNKKLFDKAYDD